MMEQRSLEMDREMDEMKDELQAAQDSRKRLIVELKSLTLNLQTVVTASCKGRDIAKLETLADSRGEWQPTGNS